MIPWKCDFLFSEGERIYYETAGAARAEAIVFCHGLGGNHASWFQQIPDFALNHYVVTWDQRGFGCSTNLKYEAGPAAGTRDLEMLLDHMRIQRAHLVGQSMGGWTALGCALTGPDRIASLTLADTIAGVYTPEIEAAFDDVIRRAAELESVGGERFLGVHPALGRRLFARDLARAFLYQQISSLGPPPPTDIIARLRCTAYELDAVRSMGMPVLLIVGSDDPIFSPATIRLVASQFADSRVVEIPGTGHSPYFEAPNEWNRTLDEFLRRSKAASQLV